MEEDLSLTCSLESSLHTYWTGHTHDEERVHTVQNTCIQYLLELNKHDLLFKKLIQFHCQSMRNYMGSIHYTAK